MGDQPADRAAGGPPDDDVATASGRTQPPRAAVFDVVGLGDLRARLLEGADSRVEAPATEPPSSVVKRIAVSVPSPRDGGSAEQPEIPVGATDADEAPTYAPSTVSTTPTSPDGSSFSLDEAFATQDNRQRTAGQPPLPWWLIAAVAACIVAAVVAWLFFSREPDGVDPSGSDPRPTVAVGPSVVRLQPGGPLTASEPIVFRRPVSTVSLTVPDRSDISGLTAFEPVVSDLLVIVEGSAPQVVAEKLVVGDTVTVDLDEPTSELTLDYAARGVVRRSVPSTEGRASVLVTPLTVDTAGAQRGRLSIMGVDVLNAGCLSAAESSPCGERTTAGWDVKRPAMRRTSDVLAQVDMLAESP